MNNAANSAASTGQSKPHLAQKAPVTYRNPKFFNVHGRLTAYALACGYIEQRDINDKVTTLWHEGGPCYHVRQHDFKTNTRVFWDSFESLPAARARYDQAIRQTNEESENV